MSLDVEAGYFIHYLKKALNLFYFSLQVTDKPVAVGFGISKPEHVKQVREVTITSSALLIKEWLILWLSLTRPFRFRWTDCGVGCRWGDNWQCNGETVG